MAFLTPKEVLAQVKRTGLSKVQLSTSRLLLLGFFAGAYIAFGGLLAIKIGGGMPSLQASNPGLVSLVFGSVFPVGLILVILAGAELFTGNTATLIPALYKGELTTIDLLRSWTLSYLGNFIGSLFVAFFLVKVTGVLEADPWLSFTKGIAQSKVSQEPMPLFLKALACNWLVCLSVWLATAANNISGKIFGIWFPIMAFVALGFEHSVANMFFIPLGIFHGAEVTWSQFIFDNLLIVTAGNIVGGAVFVGLSYAYVYGERG